MRGFRVQTQLAGGTLPVGAASQLVPFTRVRVVMRRLAEVTVDRIADFPSSATTVPLSVDVPLLSNADSGEVQDLSLAYINAAGDTVFRAGPTPVRVVPTRPGQEPPVSPTIVLRYTGPGATAARVRIVQRADSVLSGNAFSLSAVAEDAQQQPVTAPIAWSSLDTALAQPTTPAAGTGTTRAGRGSARIVAQLLTGQADTVAVFVRPRPQTLSLVSGGGQSGTQGAALPQPIVVRVTATDGLPVAGVSVFFAAGTNSGSPSAGTAVTDANGQAQVTWTLGVGSTAQQLTVTATGLTGSPLTVLATPPPLATQLAFGVQPGAVVAGAAIAPAITVRAETGAGALVTTYTGPVTLSIGNGPAGATLGGTLTVNAVAGIATFTGLTLPRAGTGYALVATATGLTAAQSGTFSVAPAAASTLQFTTSPADGNTSAVLLPTPTVTAVDAFGNVATGFTGAVSLAFGANPGAATLAGTTSVAAVNGVASFPGLSIANAGVGYTLVASATGLASATSAAFTIISTTSINSWTNAAGGTWSTAANWSLARAPNGTDSVVIALPGTYTVTMDVNFTGTHLAVGGGAGTQTLAVGARSLSLGGSSRVLASGALTLAAGGVIGGAGALQNDGIVTLGGGSVSAPVTNGGSIIATGSSSISTITSNGVTGVVEVRPVGSVVTTLTINTSFTNSGTILLTNSGSAGGVAQLVMPAGQTLTNAGRIRSLLGAGAGQRTLNATVVNQDTIDVRQFGLTMTVPTGSTWLNQATGVVRADSVGDVAVTATGATLTNLGTILTGTRTFAQTGGTLNLTAGSLVGDAGTLVTNGVTLNLNLANSRTRYNFGSPGSTLGSALTIPVGDSLRVVGGSLTTTPGFTINGRLVALSTSTFSGVSLPAGGTMEVRPVGSVLTTLTINTSFTNAGTILLTNSGTAGGVAQLVLPAGQTLTNAGRIRTLVGAGAGSRALNATVVNQDTIDVRQFDLTLTAPSGSTWLNQPTGVIRADSIGDIAVTATGATFTNAGTILTGARTFTQTGGTLNLTAGSLAGDAGTLITNGVTLNLNLANSRTRYNFGSPSSTLASALTIPAGDSLRVVGGALTTTPGFTINGRLVALGTATFSGVSLPASGTMEVRPVGSVVTALTVNTSFTNAGTILLTNSVSAGGVAQLVLPAGQTLTNAGRIRTLVGAGAGSRALNAAVVNQDTIDVRQFDLSMTVPTGATWLNQATGVVRADSVGDVTVTATGATLTNLGTILTAARTFTQTGGTLNLTAGSLAGDAGTLVTNGVTLNLNLANSRTRYNFGSPGSTLASALTIPAGDSLRVVGGALTTTPGFAINGRLVALGSTTFSGVSLPAGGTMEVRPVGSVLTTLTINTSFTNAGTILLTNSVSAGGVAQLVLPAGQTLTNAGRIRSLLGAGAGQRTLNAAVVNQDTIDVRQFDLNLTVPSTSTWLNDATGVIRADSVGDIAVTATGATLTNNGTILTGARTFTQTGGTLNLTTGSLLGDAGTLVTNGVTLNLNLANSRTRYNFGSPSSTLGSALTIPAGDSLRVVGGGLTTTPGFTINGRLVALSSTTFSGVSLPAGGTMEVRPVGSVVTTLTINTSFTNAGTILLTNSVSAGGVAQLVLPAGQTLTNAGRIRTLVGAGAGSRVLNAAVVNQDTIDVRQFDLNLTVPSTSTWLNDATGVIRADSVGDIAVTATGATLTNNGTILTGARTFTQTGGTLNLTTGSLLGDAGTLATSGVTLNLNLANSRTRYNFGSPSSTLGSALTIPAGDSLRVVGGGLTTTPGFTVNGRLVALGNTTLSGMTLPAGGTVEVRPVGSVVTTLTVNTGFTNNGTILLTNSGTAGGVAVLQMAAGQTLTNAGRIRTLLGAGGGQRNLNGAVVNQDTIDVRQFPLNMILGTGATWLNQATGVVRADSVGDILVTATGATLTNEGTILMGARTFTQSGGTLNLTAGTFSGDAGTLVTNGVTALNLNLANARTRFNFGAPASTLASPLTIPAGDSLRFVGGALTTTPGFTVNGRLIALGSSNTLSGLSVPAGGVVEVRPVGSVVTTLNVNSSFTNNGTILLTNSGGAGGVSQFVMPAGQTLTNAGTIQTAFGAGSGSRNLTVPLVVNSAGANMTVGFGLTLNGALDQSGTLTVNGGIANITGLTRLLPGSFTTNPNGTLNFSGGCQNTGGPTVLGLNVPPCP